MVLQTKRDRNQPVSVQELYEIEAAAKEEGNELVEQLAATLAESLKWCDKAQDIRDVFLEKARAFIALFPYSGELKETIPARAFEQFKDFVIGLSTGELDALIKSIHFDSEGSNSVLQVSYKTNWAAEVVSASISKMLRKDDGSYWNNITFTLHDKGEQFDVVVQRRSGKSVKDQLNEAQARIKELEAQIDKMEDDALQAAEDAWGDAFDRGE